MATIKSERTPSLDRILRRFVDDSARNLWTMMPGRIITYDPTKQLAEVEVMIKDATPGSEPEPLPVINNVPVLFPRTQRAFVHLPVNPNDLVMLVFGTRSLDKWESGDGNQKIDPQDTRHHALADAVAIPGLYPFADAFNITPLMQNDLRILLLDASGAIRSQFYLGGDTGDVVTLAENKVMLGAANPTNGVARKEDTTISNAATDATYWPWLAGFVDVFITAWVVNPTDGGAALKTALVNYIVTAVNPVPTQLAGKIDSASAKVLAD